jgi:hypothetical protein
LFSTKFVSTKFFSTKFVSSKLFSTKFVSTKLFSTKFMSTKLFSTKFVSMKLHETSTLMHHLSYAKQIDKLPWLRIYLCRWRGRRRKIRKSIIQEFPKQTTYKIRHIRDHLIRRVFNVKSHSVKLFRTKRYSDTFIGVQLSSN